MVRSGSDTVKQIATCDMQAMREDSIALLAKLGVNANVQLPLSDDSRVVRSPEDVFLRATALCLCVARAHEVAFDFVQWADERGVTRNIETRELAFLKGTAHADEIAFYRGAEEALWLLCWALKFHNRLRLDKVCDQSLASMSPGPFMATPWQIPDTLSLRSDEEVMRIDDALYLLANALVQPDISAAYGLLPFKPYVTAHRRIASGWLLQSCDYYDVPLDT